MGEEARCIVRFGDSMSEGKALLETDELIFRPEGRQSGRGDIRLAISFRSIRSVEANNGNLSVEFSEGVAVFELGAQAKRWAQKILNPKTLLDKLGVNPSMRVSVWRVEDESFLRDVRERTPDVTERETALGSDMIFVGIKRAEDLKRLRSFKRRIKPNGGDLGRLPQGPERVQRERRPPRRPRGGARRREGRALL